MLEELSTAPAAESSEGGNSFSVAIAGGNRHDEHGIPVGSATEVFRMATEKAVVDRPDRGNGF